MTFANIVKALEILSGSNYSNHIKAIQSREWHKGHRIEKL